MPADAIFLALAVHTNVDLDLSRRMSSFLAPLLPIQKRAARIGSLPNPSPEIKLACRRFRRAVLELLWAAYLGLILAGFCGCTTYIACSYIQRWGKKERREKKRKK